MKPMLAFKLDLKRIQYPIFVQPKFNGVRSLYLPFKRTCQSRDENLWHPEVIPSALTQLTSMGFVTDGEFYCHGMSLQQINSRIAVNRLTAHDEEWKISYYLFDVPTKDPMWKRAKMLESLRERYADRPNIQIAQTQLVYSASEADYWYKIWMDQGYEGMMYRQYDSPYGFEHNCGNKENRWWYLQKRKEFLDMYATITGVYEGEDGFTGMLGGFHCEMENGVSFDVGGGLTHDDRIRYWHDPACVIGARIRVNYEMLSDGGQPLKATIESVDELY